jgi:hypothetical protein
MMIGLGNNLWFPIDWSKWNFFAIGILTQLTTLTNSEIVGKHLMAHESPQMFIQKHSIALTIKYVIIVLFREI